MYACICFESGLNLLFVEKKMVLFIHDEVHSHDTTSWNLRWSVRTLFLAI